MSGYAYSNDYERKEIELNKRLCEACMNDPIDFTLVAELLEQGADPLGGTGQDGTDCVYNEVLDYFLDSDGENLPRLTELFLQYGMDVDHPRVPYDDCNSSHPLWSFSFASDESATVALKMLLDHGLSADGFAKFWDHAMTDYFHCACGDPVGDEFWNQSCVRTFKMLLLGASYDHILDNDEILREFICCDFNTYDVHKFRNWNDFAYTFDTSHCRRGPELYGSVVRIYEKTTHTEVWKIGVGEETRKMLEKEHDIRLG